MKPFYRVTYDVLDTFSENADILETKTAYFIDDEKAKAFVIQVLQEYGPCGADRRVSFQHVTPFLSFDDDAYYQFVLHNEKDDTYTLIELVDELTAKPLYHISTTTDTLKGIVKEIMLGFINENDDPSNDMNKFRKIVRAIN